MGCPSFQQWRPVALRPFFSNLDFTWGVVFFSSFFFLFFLYSLPPFLFSCPFQVFFSLSLCLSVWEGTLVDDTLRRIQNDAIFFSPSPSSLLRSPLCRIGLTSSLSESSWLIEDHNDREISTVQIERSDDLIFFFFFFFFLERGPFDCSSFWRSYRAIGFLQCHYRSALRNDRLFKYLFDWTGEWMSVIFSK